MAFWSKRPAPPPTPRPAIRTGHFPPINQPGGGDVEKFVVTHTVLADKPNYLGRYKDFPTVDDWRREAYLYFRPGVWYLGGMLVSSRIEAFLRLYWDPNAGMRTDKRSFAQLYLLQDMYYMFDSALKPGRDATTHELQVVMDLYLVTVAKLCEYFAVHVNVLPMKLEAFKGVREQGARRDRFQAQSHQPLVFEHRDVFGRLEEDYLTAAELEHSRLEIEHGVIRSWSTPDNGVHWVPPTAPDGARYDTRNTLQDMAPEEFIGMTVLTDVRGNLVDATGRPSVNRVEVDLNDENPESGYVFSIWDTLYSGRHDERRFHSQYTSGEAIVCAGTMTVRDGRLTAISNFSGHYKPGRYQLMPVLWYLLRHGVDLTRVNVVTRASETHVNVTRASEYLSSGGAAVTYRFQLTPAAP